MRPHPNIMEAQICDEHWCYLGIAYRPGKRQSPWQNGYLWQTYFGWHHTSSSLGSGSGEFGFEEENLYGCGNQDMHGWIGGAIIRNCCTKHIYGTDPDEEVVLTNVPCTLYAIPKEDKEKEIVIDVDVLPITITLE